MFLYKIISMWDDKFINWFELIWLFHNVNTYQNTTLHPINTYNYYLSIKRPQSVSKEKSSAGGLGSWGGRAVSTSKLLQIVCKFQLLVVFWLRSPFSCWLSAAGCCSLLFATILDPYFYLESQNSGLSLWHVSNLFCFFFNHSSLVLPLSSCPLKGPYDYIWPICII